MEVDPAGDPDVFYERTKRKRKFPRDLKDFVIDNTDESTSHNAQLGTTENDRVRNSYTSYNAQLGTKLTESDVNEMDDSNQLHDQIISSFRSVSTRN